MTLGIIRYPLAILLSGSIGRTGIWWAFIASNVSGVFLAYFWFRKGYWKGKMIRREDVEKGEVAGELSTLEETISE